MQYLISDIHGQSKDFKQMLKKISFDSEKDNLIIMGDIIDRGPDGIRLLEFIKPYLNNSMKLMMGNHELFAIMYLKGILHREPIFQALPQNPKIIRTLSERTWTAFGGKDTINAIKQMTVREQEELLSFLESLPLYYEIHSDFFGKTIVTHTGIDSENYVFNSDRTINVKKSIENAAINNLYNYMVGLDLHQIPKSDKERFDHYLIVGHVPCYRLNEKGNKFYRTEYYMDIDAGAGHKKQGGTLGCYCVTTDKEFYLS